jgi:AraC-like DNA-binding protein
MRVPYMDIIANYMDTPERRVLDLRPAGLAQVPMLGVYTYNRAHPDLPVHHHARGLEICFLARGNQTFEVGGQIYRLRGGDVFVTFPDEPHSTGGAPSEPGVLYWLNLRLPAPGHRLLDLPRDESAAIVAGLVRLPERHFRATRPTKSLFGELFKLYDATEVPHRGCRLRCTVLRLLLEILDGARRHGGTASSPRLREIVRLIREHPQDDYSLRDLSRRAHVSLSHFKRVFKAETGLAPREYILQAKIETAKARLRRSDASVTQIALELGFVSSQYFATVFRRLTGTTPTAYRRLGEPRVPSWRREDGQG